MKRDPEMLPGPICVGGDAPLDELLPREWLLTNRLGSYAASTVLGCNTRRYHGLLIAATSPPVGRIATLATIMEQVTIGERTVPLATNEFAGTFSPRGYEHLDEFCNDVVPRYRFRVGDVEIYKEIALAEAENVAAVRYRAAGGGVELQLSPFVALRDFHHLRRVDDAGQPTFELTDAGLKVSDTARNLPPLHLQASGGEFQPEPRWWYRFQYSVDLSRGQDSFEDLWCPGDWRVSLQDGQSVQITASLHEPARLDFDAAIERRRERLQRLVDGVGKQTDEPTRRLAMAADAFVVERSFPDRPSSTTILAGYPWFADWGRDTFIALPGLLLSTRRYDRARQVFETFASAMSGGMIPNRFDDYSLSAHYNAVDASLWFVVAADRYMEATHDREFWGRRLLPAVRAILTAYREGTRFGIHAAGDGLLEGGSEKTQLTWMDAALGDEVITPRHGKAVEVNALWYCAHRIVATRAKDLDSDLACEWGDRADAIGRAFVREFWNDEYGWLHDCITNGRPDATLRPNQIFAVSLPHSPLDRDKQRAVVSIVLQKLLTPYGLRTLSPDDPRYRSRYGGSWESRDRAYHQGTVWAWLMCPFIEAYLKVEGDAPLSVGKAKLWLQALEGHLSAAGLGQVSEIFDGEPPHTPRGCFAQAWSVAELLRAKLLVREYEAKFRAVQT